ncbi:MAG: DUF2062 domain-containing protein [Proteobacteria bacterium]|nr:DUF2062 domain-containing protein [Pseudomonadota bacterium]
MPRRFFKRISPKYKDIKEAWYLRPFQALIHDPALWATHRKAVVPAVALGIFVAFIPLPIHPLLAAGGAIFLRVNLPVALVAVWINNPLTIAPIYYSGYVLGSFLLGRSPPETTDWQVLIVEGLWPMTAGLLCLGSLLALLSYFGLNAFWRWSMALRLKRRRKKSLIIR